jgi:hypothetical protein
MIFAKAAALKFSSNYVTDHNRSDVGIDWERIEKANRMANGTMRKYVIADKRTFSVSWEKLPHTATYSVDGKWAVNEMKTFYLATPGAFNLTITYGDATTEVVSVMFTKFDATLQKRGRYDMYSLSITLVEV